ncbi:hypothetical protein J2TS6_43710 [Paenibacillus albilobatus]|uniref:Uncharacterized protein n=1 Tax=Paenibacillus albilobatus TaxID=2716884 RepID=A0A919XMP4_9BACL|nr:hypothetical protein J2TS6_43710 [Paenibacillus albilobatus]
MNRKLIDPIFQETPWEIIYDNAGRQIGEVYLLPSELRKEAGPYDPFHGIRRTGRPGKAKIQYRRRVR